MPVTPKTSAKRVFLAVPIPDPLRDSIKEVQRQLKPHLPPINWVRPESIHLTVKFLGYVIPALIEEIRSLISPLILRQPSFSVDVHGFGGFPDIRYPRILWTGITGKDETLKDFVERLDEALDYLGFPMEKKGYHPHLTLARIKRDHKSVGLALTQQGFLQKGDNLGCLPIHHITLFQSELSRSGAVYAPLWSVPLNGDSQPIG